MEASRGGGVETEQGSVELSERGVGFLLDVCSLQTDRAREGLGQAADVSHDAVFVEVHGPPRTLDGASSSLR